MYMGINKTQTKKYCSLSNSDAAAHVPPPHEISAESPVGGTVHEIEDAGTTVSVFNHLVQCSVAFPK